MMITLTEETRADFAATYDRLKAEYFGPRVVTDVEELTLVNELIQQAEAGDVAHNGAIHHITPAEVNYLDAATLAATQPRRGLSRGQQALLGGLGAALLGYVLLNLLGGLSSPSPAATTTVSPTVAAGMVTTSTLSTPTPVPPTAVADFPASVNGQQLLVVRPNTLELAGRSFLAYVTPVKDGNWAVSHDPGLANWVPGATVNWSFALYVDTDPTAPPWVASLTPPLTATVRTADGRARLFQIKERQTIQRTQTEVLDPHWAGLTVVVKTTPGDTRLLLRGQELAPDLAPTAAVRPLVSPGPAGGETPP